MLVSFIVLKPLDQFAYRQQSIGTTSHKIVLWDAGLRVVSAQSWWNVSSKLLPQLWPALLSPWPVIFTTVAGQCALPCACSFLARERHDCRRAGLYVSALSFLSGRPGFAQLCGLVLRSQVKDWQERPLFSLLGTSTHKKKQKWQEIISFVLGTLCVHAWTHEHIHQNSHFSEFLKCKNHKEYLFFLWYIINCHNILIKWNWFHGFYMLLENMIRWYGFDKTNVAFSTYRITLFPIFC